MESIYKKQKKIYSLIRSYCAFLKSGGNHSKGFTIVEAMVAIFILTVSVSSMLSITATASNSARYANNEITANYLIQEAVDSIRNSRDTIAFQKKNIPGAGWSAFLSRYGNPGGKCFTSSGCYLSMDEFDYSYTSTGGDVDLCPGTCPYLRYDSSGNHLFYNYTSGEETKFRRTVKMEAVNPTDEVKITVTMDWANGARTRTQTLVFTLLNWQKDF